MYIIDTLYSYIKVENKEIKYSFRMTKEKLNLGQAFGIEVERQDLIEGKVIQVERDFIKRISNKEEKVKELLNLLHTYQVSPIHLVDIIGEYVDNYVYDFNF